MAKYRGSCHCGTIAFEVDGTIDKAMACNCSICQRKGSLLWFVQPEAMTLLTPEDAARVYEFNHHRIHHRFCPTCGIHPYADGVNPKGAAMRAINVRCLEGIDLASIPVSHFDGRALS
jgi:hypothetical protein